MIRTTQLIWNNEFQTISESFGFSSYNAQLSFIFADRLQLNQELLNQVKNKFPNSTIVFGSTSGHFSTQTVEFDQPVITAVEFEKTYAGINTISNIPKIVLIGFVGNDICKAKALGFTDYITKPFNVQNLNSKLAMHLNTKPIGQNL